MGKFDRNENSCRSSGPTVLASGGGFLEKLSMSWRTLAPRPADGPDFVLCFTHVSIKIFIKKRFFFHIVPWSDLGSILRCRR